MKDKSDTKAPTEYRKESEKKTIYSKNVKLLILFCANAKMEHKTMMVQQFE